MNKPKILIVEDGDSQRFLLTGFLIRETYPVCEAENGIKAIELVRSGHFDIILLDYKLPGMDSVTALKEIKEIDPEIDVVVISAYGTIERAVEATQAGAFYYITKPVDLEKLLILLDRITKRRAIIRNRNQQTKGDGAGNEFLKSIIKCDASFYRFRKAMIYPNAL
jgi:DNA-binding NtrC family response regulator